MLTPAFFGTQLDSGLFWETLDDVLGTAARLFSTRLVAVSRVEGSSCTMMALIDHKRQIRSGQILPLDATFCGTMLEQNAPLQINNVGALPDADRYASNPLGIPINAYLGVPLRLSGGRVFGSLWTIDSEPYTFTPNDVRMLGLLARSLTHELEATATQRQHKRIEHLQATRMDIDPLTGVLGRDGFRSVVGDQGIWRQEGGMFTVAVVQINPLTDSRAGSDVAHQGLADMIMRTMRLIDHCGRLDDMSYGVLLPNSTRPDLDAWQRRLRGEIAAWNRVHHDAGLAFEIALGAADSTEVAGSDNNPLLVLERARQQVE